MVNRRWLKPEVAFSLVDHPFLTDIYNCTAQELVIYKASQVGASEYAISYALHAADVRGATGLYVFPTDTHVSDFSSARIGPAIEASPYLSGIVVEGRAAGGRRGADRVTLKRVRDRFLYLRGGQVSVNGSAPQLKSIDADVLVLDELDEMDPRAPSIAVKRLGHSRIAEVRWVSTPSFPGIGVYAKWQESDQREWHVRCAGCNTWQPLTIDLIVTEWDDLGRPRRWNGDKNNAGNVCYPCCSKCGKPLDRLGVGRWIATNPGAVIAGFHLTKLFSPRIELLNIIRTLQTTNETKRRECYNQDLGLPYAPKGGRLSEAELDACRRDYGHRPVGGEQPVMGIDVGRVLHGVIRGHEPTTGARPQRWAGEIASFDDVDYLISRYQVRRLVIDALPETTQARKLQERHPSVVWLAYYVTQKIGTKRAEPVQWDDEQGVVNLDRTRTLDQTLSRFFDQINTLPGDARDIPGYYAHMMASTRVIEDGPSGEKVIRYVESGPDHLFHAENYCTVASFAPIEELRGENLSDFGGYGGNNESSIEAGYGDKRRMDGSIRGVARRNR